MLESFLGGSAAPQEQTGSMGGIGDLLESFMGGGQQASVGANPLMAPFTDALAEKLGISHQMAAVIVSFAFSLLMSKLSGAATQGSTGIFDAQSPEGGFDLDDLLSDDYLDSKGITAQLTEQTGMEDDEAKESLREAVAMLNGQLPEFDEPSPPPTAVQQSDLQDLLDTWEE
jgi:hypothetical protein